ncbi:iron-containing redox enzyme family protein, partial [Candidatus Parcubacteria bacterium]|nr:iron-containing redox enzyme family protein [Candidatus Parcubacteria bacterium]
MTTKIKEKVHSMLEASQANAKRHPFFSRFTKKKTREEIEEFARQWYLAAYNHKRAFPFLPAITADDETRRELIEVLRDEYGNGDTNKVHAKLLSN